MDERRAGRTVDAMVKRSLLRFIEGSSRTLLSRSRRLHHRLVHMYALGQFLYCNKYVTSHKELVPYQRDTLLVSPLKRNDLKSTHWWRYPLNFAFVKRKNKERKCFLMNFGKILKFCQVSALVEVNMLSYRLLCSLSEKFIFRYPHCWKLIHYASILCRFYECRWMSQNFWIFRGQRYKI